jgi:DNA polymerase-3 subunit alpha
MNTVADVLNGGKTKNSGQQSIFGTEVEETERETGEWEEAELLKNEKEALGFYITGHPLTRYDTKLRKMKTKKTSDLEHATDKEEVIIGGILRGLKRKNVKSTGDMMAYVSLEDDEGSIEVIVFSEIYKSVNAILKKDALILVKGSIDRDEKGVRLRAKEISVLENAGKDSTKGLEIAMSDAGASLDDLKKIRSLVEQYPGDSRLYLRIKTDLSQALIATAITLQPDDILINTLENIIGRGSVTLL